MSEEDKENIEKAPSKKGRSGRLKGKSSKKEPEAKKPPKERRSARRRSKRPAQIEEEEHEKSQGKLWLEQNWKTVLALSLIFLFGIFLRSYFYYGPATEDGFILSGNDPYYHKRVVDYVQNNHEHLVFDPLLSYPDGSFNPRPPLFDWSIAIVGLLLSPLFGGNVSTSTWQVMEFAPAFWGALTAIPVFFIGKEMFNKKVGIICAFFLATMPSHVERSPLGFSDHDAIVLFFVVLSFFFFIKALNHLKVRDKWVENWMKPREIPSGFKEWFKYNQESVAYAFLTGFSLATIAFIWKGFLYPVVIIIVYFFIQLLLNKLRNKDSLGIALCTIIPLIIVAFLPLPYYIGNNLYGTIRPASEILLAVIVVSAVLVPTRDSPWLLVFSTLAIILACGLILLMYVFPDIGSTYFSGQGYFGENKIFSTIAEAQAPDYSRAMFSYGVVTTFLALFGILLSILKVAKDLKTHYLFMTIWGITAVYMAISATRFIFNAGPIFAILSGWIIYELVVKLNFKRMFKHYRSLKGGGRFYALKKSVKVRHIVGVLFLVFMILIPNVWLGWDAGIPFGHKKDVDVAVYDAFPWFMKPQEDTPDGEGVMYNRTNANDLKYFGAFGHGFPSDYWLDSMEWLSEQDTELPIEDRPAFISWWDYGFWAIELGEHPTAADNFQGRVQYAGSFISARGEEEGVALLIARILEADRADYRYKEGHDVFKLHTGVRNIMVKYFGEENTSKVEDVLINTPKYKSEVLENPDEYGYYTEDLVPEITPIYAILQKWIPEMLSDDEMTWLYHELQEETEYSLRYFAIDSRLFPFGPQNTGIYYAPLKLSDHRISESNEPYDFLQTIIVGSDSREYTLEEFRDAQESNIELTAEDFKLKYYDAYLDSMLMKCYIGYTLEDIGATDSTQSDVEPNLPGVHTQNFPPMQAWMMKHFQVVYRTAYWNPYNSTEYPKHQDAWEAMLDTEANDLVEQLENDGVDNDNNGIIDDRGEGGVVTSGLRSGVVYIKYYEGAYLNGTVRTNLGTPVPGIRITVRDEYGIPHDSVLTDENGTYRLLAPSGNVTVDVSTGGFGEGESLPFNLLGQREEVPLNSTNIEISDDQVMRREIDDDNDGVWDYIINHDFEIEANTLDGIVYWDLDSDGEYNKNNDQNISSANVILYNMDKDIEYSSESDSDGIYGFEDLTPGTYNVTLDVYGHEIPFELAEPLAIGEGIFETIDLHIKPGELVGNISSENGTGFVEQEFKVFDSINETEISVTTDSEGNFSLKWLLPGNYSATVDINGFESYSEIFEILQENTTSLSISLWSSTRISGEVTNTFTSLPISNATIKIYGIEGNLGFNKFVKTDANGEYSIDLRNGKYSLDVKHDIGGQSPLIYKGEIEVLGGAITLDIGLQQSIEIYGTVYRDFDGNGSIEPHESRPYADVRFESNSWKSETSSNFTGFYRVFVPPGDYNVYATWKTTRGSYSQQLSVSGLDKVEHNIEVINGKSIEGYVYYDISQDDTRQGHEALAYPTLVFKDVNGTDIMVNADSEGFFKANLPFGRNYTVIAQMNGFVSNLSEPMNVTELAEIGEIELAPYEITVTGITHEDQTAVANVSISFNVVHVGVGINETPSADPSGVYSVDLLPGEYTVIVDYNTTESGKPVRYVFYDTIKIEAGEGTRNYDIPLTKLITINGSITGTSENVSISFDPTQGTIREEVTTVNGTFELFLGPGEYVISVDHEVNSTLHYVYINTFSFMESETMTLDLAKGVFVSGDVKYDGTNVNDIDIQFIANDTLIIRISGGSYEIFLPPNTTYEVIINGTKEEGKTVKYVYSDVLDVNTTDNTSFNINVSKFILYSGNVYFDWDNDNTQDPSELIDNITISFENGNETLEVLTSESGYYELYLELEVEYDVTLSGDFPIKDEGITQRPSLPTNTEFDFEITPENLTLSGRTKSEEGTLHAYTTLWFSGDSSTAINLTSSSNENGNYSVALSPGDYEIYARKVSGSSVYAYAGQVTIRPRGDLYLDLILEPAAKVRGKAYHVNSTGQNLSIGVRIEFGDKTSISTISDSNGHFELWLPPGNYDIVADYTTNEYNISMDYTYDKKIDITGDKTLYLNLTKEKLHTVQLEWNENDLTEIGKNESVMYIAVIKNTGNVKDTYDLSHTSDPLWNITFPLNFTLDIGESREFEVSIKVSENAKVEHEKITLFATSRSVSSGRSDVELKVNITPYYQPADIEESDIANSAKDNTLSYHLRLINVGNIVDNFTFSLANIPVDWNITLNPESADLLDVGETKEVELTITIPYNSTIMEATIKFISTSEEDMVSEFDLAVSISEVSLEDDDLTISGEDVSEGELITTPIPGFETLAMIAALLGVAVFMKRRRVQ